MTNMSAGWVARTLLGICLGATLTTTAVAATMEGFWKGGIAIPGRELEVMIEITHGEVWAASVYVPAQGIRGAGMTGVAVEGDAITMVIPDVPGEPTFVGRLDEDGGSIAGDFTQGGATLAFHLTRSDKPEELAVDVFADFEKPGVPGEGLTGTWNGLIEVGPHRLRLVLSVSTNDSGQPAVRLVSLDQGNAEFEADEVQHEGNTVHLDFLDIDVQFDGILDEKQSEMTGAWKQGGQQIPLTFSRAAS